MVKKKQLKQPLFHRVLNHLGLLDMPSKVNCWYCNNDSFLLPGNRDTIYNWYCHMCENRNMTDINGDIIDPSIFDTNNKSDSEHKYCKPIKLRETPCSICVDCQRNQSLVYQFLSEYIPDENDPNYKYRYETADDYKHSLEDKYRICSKCNAKLDQVLHEQIDVLNIRRFNEILAKSLTSPPPKKPTKTNYITKGLLWTFIHISTLFIMIYVSMYLPNRSTLDEYQWREWLAWMEMMRIEYMDMPWDSMVEHAQNWIRNISLCLFQSSNHCEWNITQYFLLFIAVNILSWKSIDWHPTAYRTFQEKGRIGHWRFYQITQRSLYLYRFIIIIGTTFTHYLDDYMYILMVIYMIPLLFSIYYVKVPRRLKKVGSRLEFTSRDTSSISDTSKKPVDDDLMSMTEMSIVSDNRDNDLDAITSKFCNIKV